MITFNTCSRLSNPVYNHTPSSAVPAVQYSSIGPRDTPTTGHAPPQGGEERIYEVVEGDGEEAGEQEGGYHVISNMREGKKEEMTYAVSF